MTTWQKAIHEYVQLRNRAELDPIQPLKLNVEDASFIHRETARRFRAQQVLERRNTQLLRSETRLKLKESGRHSDVVIADLYLKRRLEYSQFGHRFVEERIEQERLKLREGKKGWRIESVMMDVGELQPVTSMGLLHGKSVVQEAQANQGSSQADSKRISQLSQPYMNEAVLMQTRHWSRNRKTYQREQAVQYADTWWDVPNPEYKLFDVNCTNFVSQCLYAGGAPMNYTGKRSSGWWYRHQQDGWSYSWSVSNSLLWYLSGNQSGLTAQTVNSPMELQLGDVIFYDWNGDGHYQHSTVVTGFDAHGMPLVHANTTNSRYRYWDYQDSYAWSERTRYRFFHISIV